MTTTSTHRRVALFAGAVALLLQMSPSIAQGQLDNQRPVAITYTKWVNTVPQTPPAPNISLLEGVTGGDVIGIFSGEVLRSQLGSTLDVGVQIQSIEAVYRVTGDNGGPSFTALLRGGRTNTPTGGDALLDGFVLDGWRTGAPVHVEFTRIPASSPSAFACAEVPRPGIACFQGTIHIGRAPVD
jgi:hypothetical protein